MIRHDRALARETSASVSRIELDLAVVKGDVSHLRRDVSLLQGDVSQLRRDVSELQKRMAQLGAQLDIFATKWRNCARTSQDSAMTSRT